MVIYCLENDDLEGIRRLLGSEMSLKKLYPHRNNFYIKEYVRFYCLAVMYFCLCFDLEEAEIRLNMIKKADPKSQEAKNAAKCFHATKMRKNSDEIQELENKRKKDNPPEEFIQYKADEAQAGRNDPCPCGSGKKYKKCCLK